MKKFIALFAIATLGISATASSAAQNIAALATNVARGAQSDESAYFVMTIAMQMAISPMTTVALKQVHMTADLTLLITACSMAAISKV